MTKTYTEEEHRMIAEFAGWKADERCNGKGQAWPVWKTAVGVPLTASQPSPVLEIQYLPCIHGRISEHVILPPPLDDALAMLCLRKLGEATHLELSALDEWTVEIFFDAEWKVFGADDPRDAIFAAVLAICGPTPRRRQVAGPG